MARYSAASAAAISWVYVRSVPASSAATPIDTVTCTRSPPTAPGASCGTTRTAADVPVIIKVTKGNVPCGTALQVENEYAAKIRDGQVAGNGGGAPVTVDGWTCQGYPTPEVLRTGNASQCHTGSSAIVAVLPVPAPAAS